MSTANPNYRPYLSEGDLITSEDALLWLSARAHSTDNEGRSGREALVQAEEYLRARLDRERRAACRKGVRELFSMIQRKKLWLRSDYDTQNGKEHFGSFAKCMQKMREHKWGQELRLALELRSAAREK